MTDIPARLATALADRYRIERELGAGGMATVYLAEDLKHHRQVAIKVLKPELAAVLGAERFVQEIQTTAQLQHPHILPLFDSGQADGFLYYVMPYIEGETLRTKLDREKQLGIDEAVKITTEVADALDYAHRHGVIHRDIKPENILLHDGRPMVADFGIALAVSAAAGGRMTETGLSLGTPHYMSPEQATAEKDLTNRSDIYSLGSVLYEMLTGNPPHTGASAQQIIMKIVTDEAAPVTKLRKSVPPNVAAAVSKSIEKLPADRFATAAEFAAALGSVTFTVPGPLQAGIAARPTWVRAAAIGALVVAAAVAGSVFGRRSTRVTGAGARPMVQFGIELPAKAGLGGARGSTIAFAPDGARLAYVGQNQLYVRGLAQLDPAPVAGSEAGVLPFFAPDGQSLGFVQGGRLVRVALAGGPVLTICKAPGDVFGATWTTGDTILFAADSGVYDVPAQGGAARLIARPERGERFEWPDILPDERYALLTSVHGDTVELAVLDRRAGTVDRLGTAGAYPRYVRTGFVTLILPPGQLVAVPFDASRRAVTGGAIPIVDLSAVGSDGDANVGVSRAGDFAYQTLGGQRSHLVLVDRRGIPRNVGQDTADYPGPRLSPDGRRVAVGRTTGTQSDLWTVDLATGAAAPVPGGTGALWPFWIPDGGGFVYQKAAVDVRGVGRIPADGSAPARTVLNGRWLPWTFDRSGALLYYGADSGRTDRFVIRRMPLDHPESSQVIFRAPFFMIQPRVSTDGRWIAYTSDATGRREVFVSAYPGPGTKTQISQDGGEQPLWSDRGEIVYRNGVNIMAATIRVRDRVEVVRRAVLFGGRYEYNFDMSPDGNTFVMLQSEHSSNAAVIVTMNWFDQLRTRKNP